MRKTHTTIDSENEEEPHQTQFVDQGRVPQWKDLFLKNEIIRAIRDCKF
jgi:hypothetical protein